MTSSILIPHWTETPDFFVWEAFDQASRDPSRCLSDDAAQQATLLAESENFYVIPDQFGVVSGHVLVLSKVVVTSIAALDARFDDEINWLLRHVSKLISATYQTQVVVAEHGECGCATASAAHVHVLPIPATVESTDLRATIDDVLRRRMVGIERIIYRGTEFTACEDLQALIGVEGATVIGRQVVLERLDGGSQYPAEARTAIEFGRPYIFFSGPGVRFVSMCDVGSQFVREVVGQLCGLPESSWNRRANTSRANMFATFARLSPAFGRSTETQFEFMARSGM